MKKQAVRVRVSEQQAYDELCDYTFAHARQHGTFIHQHVVDAYAAQHADASTKPITLVFALMGLYMHVERGYSGTEVQRLHIAMGRNRVTWPPLRLPVNRGSMTVVDVMACPPGPERDHAIAAWCRSVWEVYAVNRPMVAELLVSYGIG
jgi:Family of unknown function (DUF5946)